MKLTDEQEKKIIKSAIASTMTEEQKALGAFLAAMHDCKLDGKKMREAMLGILGITGDGRGEAVAKCQGQACVHCEPEHGCKQAKPFAWYDPLVTNDDKGISFTPGTFHTEPLYAAPPQQEQAAPDGFVMVPKEADERIKRAIFVMLASADDEGLFYRKLIQIAAAPKAQEP